MPRLNPERATSPSQTHFAPPAPRAESRRGSWSSEESFDLTAFRRPLPLDAAATTPPRGNHPLRAPSDERRSIARQEALANFEQLVEGGGSGREAVRAARLHSGLQDAVAALRPGVDARTHQEHVRQQVLIIAGGRTSGERARLLQQLRQNSPHHEPTIQREITKAAAGALWARISGPDLLDIRSVLGSADGDPPWCHLDRLDIPSAKDLVDLMNRQADAGPPWPGDDVRAALSEAAARVTAREEAAQLAERHAKGELAMLAYCLSAEKPSERAALLRRDLHKVLGWLQRVEEVDTHKESAARLAQMVAEAGTAEERAELLRQLRQDYPRRERAVRTALTKAAAEAFSATATFSCSDIRSTLGAEEEDDPWSRLDDFDDEDAQALIRCMMRACHSRLPDEASRMMTELVKAEDHLAGQDRFVDV